MIAKFTVGCKPEKLVGAINMGFGRTLENFGDHMRYQGLNYPVVKY